MSIMQTGETIGYGYVREVALEFEQAIIKIEAALKSEGFGILCQIDIQAKFKEKLGVEFPKYVILGACNPPIAYQALQEEINLACCCRVMPLYTQDRHECRFDGWRGPLPSEEHRQKCAGNGRRASHRRVGTHLGRN